MTPVVFPAGPFSTNAYLYVSSMDREGVLIDAPPESFDPIFTYLKEHEIQLKYLLLTHSHWDHIGDVARFKKAFPEIIIAIHPDDAPNLEQPGVDRLPCWIEIEGVKPDLLLDEKSSLPYGLTVIETPGHTPGGVSFYDAKNQVLFSGDTLFQGSIGNLSFPTARPRFMWQSLKKLAILPPNTKVFPGHGPSTTIGDESWLARAEDIFG